MGIEKPAVEDFTLVSSVCFVCILAILAFLVYKLYNRVVELSKDVDNIKDRVEKNTQETPKIEEIQQIQATAETDLEIDEDSDAEQFPVISEIKSDPVNKDLSVIDEED